MEQDKLLLAIARHIDRHGWAPTYREMLDYGGSKYLGRVGHDLDELQRAGYIVHGGGPRMIRLTKEGWERVNELQEA